MDLREEISRIKTIMLIESDELEDYCKDNEDVIKNTFKSAKKWWKDLIVDPKFREKFISNNNIDQKTADKLLKRIEIIIDRIMFSLSDKLEGLEATTHCSGVNCFVRYNCNNPFEEKKHHSVFVHEIQHAINQQLRDVKLHPHTKLRELIGNPVSWDKNKFIENGKKLGFPDDILGKMVNSIEYFGVDRMYDEDETLSRIYGIRNYLNKGTSDQITKDDIFNNLLYTDIFYLSITIILSGKTIEEFLADVNLVAKNDKNSEIKFLA